MLKAAGQAISQLLDPALFGVLIVSVVGAALVLVGAWVGVAAILPHISVSGTGWLDWLVRIAIGAGAVFITLALFGAIAAMIASLFVGHVAGAVERRFYPGLPAPRRQSGREQLATGVSFLLATIALNLLALPLYAFWGANVPIFLGVNGYLMGREYFELVALRRLDRAAVGRLRRAHALKLLLAGTAIAALSWIPFAGLLTPVLATAFMLHVFYQTLGSESGGRVRVRVAETGISVIRP